MPRVDSQFRNITTIVRTSKVTLGGSMNQFIIYYHDPGPYFPNAALEMIVFRKAKIPGRLVNLHSTDNPLVAQAVHRYVFFLPLAHFPDKTRSFLNRRNILGPHATVLTLDRIITVICSIFSSSVHPTYSS
jgi:hypothetical protein